MYKFLIRPVLFLFQPETVHHAVFRIVKIACAIPGIPALLRTIYQRKDKSLERHLFGLRFPNPVGLAAGFDKDARLFDELSHFGFGFIEIGTLTPRSQPGNPQPRLFRLSDDQALINRMGFNNEGVDAAVKRLKKRRTKVIIGGNIGKNKTTPNEQATDDYIYGFQALFDYVDYFVVNVSSPNTPGLRTLQDREPLAQLLLRLQELNKQKEQPKPVLLKIAPDLSNEQLDDVIDVIQKTKIEGVIATNTTISREGLKHPEKQVEQIGAGGLSGCPLKDRSTEVIRYLNKQSGGSFPIIGVGGIHSPEDALEKLRAGASLVQLYTGFIYEGPGIVKRINKKIASNENH